jgi:hypothetical protein
VQSALSAKEEQIQRVALVDPKGEVVDPKGEVVVASSSKGNRNSPEANLAAEARICGGDRESLV